MIEKDIKKLAASLDGIKPTLDRIADGLDSLVALLTNVIGNDAEDGDGNHFIRTGDIWRD